MKSLGDIGEKLPESTSSETNIVEVISQPIETFNIDTI